NRFVMRTGVRGAWPALLNGCTRLDIVHRRLDIVWCITSATQESDMATGWAGDGAVQDQIDATVKDAIERVRSQLSRGPGLSNCEECDTPIPEARRKAVPGVRLCVDCQQARDAENTASGSGYNRRGSK